MTTRRIITQHVFDCFQLDGKTLADAVLELEVLLQTSEYSNLRVVADQGWDDQRLDILGERPETDQELYARAGRSKRAQKGWERRKKRRLS